MLMLTGYFDETGNLKDERQRFAGMAGLVAAANDWEKFEGKWKRVLDEFKIPYFHMTDYANRKQFYQGWHENKRRNLLRKLLAAIATTYPLIVGSISSLEDWRTLSAEHKSRLRDPYDLAFIHCLGTAGEILERSVSKPPDVGLAMVFAEQSEFQRRAAKYYEDMKHSQLGKWMRSLAFSDMRDLVPLQAADLVAYELYKEAERRRYRQDKDARHGYKELVKMSDRIGKGVFFLPTKADLVSQAEDAIAIEASMRRQIRRLNIKNEGANNEA